MDSFFKEMIESAEEAYAVIKLEYDNNKFIRDFIFDYKNPAFENLIVKNCNLTQLISYFIINKNFDFVKNDDNYFKWTCGGSNLNRTVNLSSLDTYHMLIKINNNNPIDLNHSNSKNLTSDENQDFKCNLEKSEKQYRLLFESMYEGFALHEIIIDDNGNPIDFILLDVNTAFEEMTHLKKKDILGHRALSIFPKIKDSWMQTCGKVAITGEPLDVELYCKEIDKTFLAKLFSPEKYKFAITFIDVTELKQLEKSLIKEKELFKTTLFSVGDAVISTNSLGRINIMNKVAESLTGWSQSEAIGKPLDEVFKVIDQVTNKRLPSPIEEMMCQHSALESQCNVMLLSKDNKLIPIENNVSPVKSLNGETQGVVLVFRDTSKFREKIRQIEFLSYHDQLTKLYNRRYFEASIEKLDQESNLPISVVIADVNGLKLANDAFGHAIGDNLLVQVSEILSKVFGKDHIVARLGGDEFAVILANTDSVKTAELVSKVKTLSEQSNFEPLKVSLALGFETKVAACENIQSVLKKAEDHMYNNKLLESQIIKNSTIKTVVKSLFENNFDEEEHSKNVSCLSRIFGLALGLESSELEELEALGLLHDIGKIAIDPDILNKPGKLTECEYNEVKRHSEVGYNILRSANDTSQIANYVLTHHENFDGTGYPKGLKGKDIPLQSRIIKIVDAYDAIMQDKVYKLPISREAAILELRRCSGTQFDPDLLEVFIDQVIKEH